MIKPSVNGKIAKDLYCLGPEEMPTYLLDGESPAMFDAGMSFLGEHYLAEIRNILRSRPLKYLFISHVHFDHCGATGYLKQMFPELTVCASPISAGIVAKPSALELIEKLSTLPGMTDSQKFIPFSVDRVMDDGDSIDLGSNGLVQAFATPGHTRDMTSYYLPTLRTLVPSEAAGVPAGNGHILSEFLADYESYFNSIHRLATLSFDRILCAHRFIYDGKDADGYFPDAIAQTEHFKEWIAELLEQYDNDHETVGRIIKAEEYEKSTAMKLPEPAYDINLKAKIRAVARFLADSCTG